MDDADPSDRPTVRIAWETLGAIAKARGMTGVSSYRATYAKGIVAFAYAGGETMFRVHTGVEPDDIEIDGTGATIDLPAGRRIVVDLLEGDTMTIERDRAGAERAQ